MSNEWVTLKKDFYNWLQDEAKNDSKLDIDEIQKTGVKKSVTKYDDKFQEFLKSQGTSEEDFTKSTIDLKDDDNKNFLDEIFDDYVDDLKSTSKEFKAIDTDGNKKISSAEKKNFFKSIKNLDGEKDDISFKDFTKAIDNFEDGNYKFLNKKTNSTSNSANANMGQIGGMSAANTSSANSNVASAEESQDYSALINEKLDQNEYQYTGEEKVDISNVTAENVDAQIELAKSNKEYAQETLDSTNMGLDDLGASYETAYASFTELNNALIESDSAILEQTAVIADTQLALSDGIEKLNTVLIPAKDEVAANIKNSNSELGNYQTELSNIDSLLQNDSLDNETKAQLQNDKTNYQTLVNTTQEKIKTLENELENCINAIEEQEEYNAEQQSLLIDAHLAYEEMIENNETLSQESKEQLMQMNTLTVNIALLTSVQANAQADVSNAETQIELLEQKKAEL